MWFNFTLQKFNTIAISYFFEASIIVIMSLTMIIPMNHI